MEHIVKIHHKDRVSEVKAQEGENLMELLRRSGSYVAAPCGGNGTCGKCRVKVQGELKEPVENEIRLINRVLLSEGYRLACQNTVTSDADVFLPDEEGEAKIQTGINKRAIELDPIITKLYAAFEPPSLEDQRSDMERIAAVYPGSTKLPLDVLKKLPRILRENDFKATLVASGGEVFAVEAGNTSGICYGVAVDVGTTTVAAYLTDMVSGEIKDVYSVLNPQRKFGADVITRINYTMGSQSALEEMQQEIIKCINAGIAHFVNNNGITAEDIYCIDFVGNTTMMHFIMQLPASAIAVSPFIPVTTAAHRIKPGELSLDMNPQGSAVILPSVSAYIGADTVAAVISSGMADSGDISLMIDIGTNGEIVLGNRDWLYCCSAAAGPAFEGSNIRNGIGGIKGAIDRVSISPSLEYTTIGGQNPIGICGSGIVDAVAAMLTEGIIDGTGRILEADELEPYKDEIASRLSKVGGMNSFILVEDSECRVEGGIAITQKDIREVQNAKAAIAAGIKILVRQAGISMEDVKTVYLAGGFGNYINIGSALKIGLIPAQLSGRIESIGNAAGAGAVEVLVSGGILEKAEEIAGRMKYIELSSSADFMDEYVECMLFEEEA